MGSLVPELKGLPTGLVLDGELVAWQGREPHFPSLCGRILNGDTSIRVTYIVFDLLGLDGTDLTLRPYQERRSLLEQLDLKGPY
jgi:bifunctional non-homologous end joining protein LigD